MFSSCARQCKGGSCPAWSNQSLKANLKIQTHVNFPFLDEILVSENQEIKV